MHNNTICAKTIIPIDCVNTSSKFNLLYLITKYANIITVTIVNGIRLVPPAMGETEYGIDDSNANYNEFNFIKKFILEKEINSSGVNNGVKVEIRGEIDNKSGYSLNNVYYTRNTIF